MIVSVCVDTVACAPRWRRLGFNDCKGSGFGVKHQTAKGKVASHAQPQTPKHPAPSMPSPTHARASSLPHPFRKPNPPPRESQNPPTPFESQTLPPRESQNPPTPFESQPLPPLSKAKPSHPAKAIFGRIFAPAKNPPRTRQEPVKNPPSALQAPPPQKKRLPASLSSRPP